MILTVTGGIGSGKSEVCRILRNDFGFPVYEADRKVKDLYVSHPSLLDDIESLLGCRLRDGEGKFMPSRLADIIFNDRNALEAVEGLVFPALIEDFHSWADSCGGSDVLVFESATVLEKPFFDGFSDKVIFVDAPFQTRLSRACARSNEPECVIRKRMDMQKLMNAISDGHKDHRIDFIVNNDSDLDALRERIREIIGRITIKI